MKHFIAVQAAKTQHIRTINISILQTFMGKYSKLLVHCGIRGI